jgi:hypothetical protein
MRLHLPIGVLALGLAAAVPAHAQPYFNCEYSPRCEAIENGQCAPVRDLKDKFALVRSHSSAEAVEKTWSVLAGFEPEYCKRLGERGNLVRAFLSYKDKVYPRLHGATCPDPQVCAEAFVKVTRERWQRDDLEARIKADLEQKSQAAIRAAAPPPPKPAGDIPAESWQTTTTTAAPAGT